MLWVSPYKHFTLSLRVNKIGKHLTADQIYQQSIDKQRIVIVGEGRDLISSLIVFVLGEYQRKFDFVQAGKPASLHADAPVLLIEADSQLLDYKHHIVILSGPASAADLASFEKLADATLKGGTIIYPELDSPLKKIGSRERTDVQAVPYSRYSSEVKDGKTLLVTSTGEKFPIAISGDAQLQYVSAARELLKKIGISSSQFYRAMSTYTPG